METVTTVSKNIIIKMHAANEIIPVENVGVKEKFSFKRKRTTVTRYCEGVFIIISLRRDRINDNDKCKGKDAIW